MAESNSGGTLGGPQKPKELSMELWLLLAFILMGVVLFVTPYFYKSVAPPKKAPVAAGKVETAPPASTNTAPAAPAAVLETAPPSSTAPAGPAVAAQAEETSVIDTDVFLVTFSNRGGVVKSWLLKKYKTHAGAPQELINPKSHAEPPAALFFPAVKPTVDLNQALYQAHADPSGLSIGFDYSNGVVVAHKSFQFRKSTYLV